MFQDTCSNYTEALMQIHKTKLEKFMNSLTSGNLRQSLLLMFGQNESTESTKNLIQAACDKNSSKIREEFRIILCDRLYEILGDKTEPTPQKRVKTPVETPKAKIVSENPVVFEKEICPADLDQREICTAKPAKGFKSTCEKAGCCWDSEPAVIIHMNFTTKKFKRCSELRFRIF
jgi:hypothetical protein